MQLLGELKYFADTGYRCFAGHCVDGNKVKVPAELTQLGQAGLADLVRVGLLDLEPGGDVPKMRMVDESLLLFVPLLTRYRINLVPMERSGCPVRFCTGLAKGPKEAEQSLAPLTRTIPAGGQGDTRKNAALSCLGELAERLSLCSLGAHDPRILDSGNGQPEVDFVRLMGLSPAQCQSAARAMGSAGVVDPVAGPDWAALSERRVGLVNLIDGRHAQFPSYAILFQETEEANRGALSFASSVGCAVWPSYEGARERAFLELAERDAAAQVWYNRLGITSIDHELLREILSGQLLGYMTSMPRHWGVYRLDTDLPVQVAMAVSHDGDGSRCAFGSAAGWDFTSACQSAVEEMLQSENALELMEKAFPERQSEASGPSHLRYARQRSILTDLPLQTAPCADDSLLRKTFSYDELLQFCADRNLSVWEFDATREDLKIPCIKLLSPDLCSWEPRFGKKRLFEGVVARGLRRQPATEAEFAARPFPF